jgi:hypothetical protein
MPCGGGWSNRKGKNWVRISQLDGTSFYLNLGTALIGRFTFSRSLEALNGGSLEWYWQSSAGAQLSASLLSRTSLFEADVATE